MATKTKVDSEQKPDEWPYGDDVDHVVVSISVEYTETFPTQDYGNIQVKAWLNAKVKPGADWRKIHNDLQGAVQDDVTARTHITAIRKLELSRHRISQLGSEETVGAILDLVGPQHMNEWDMPGVKDALRTPGFDTPDSDELQYEDDPQ